MVFGGLGFSSSLTFNFRGENSLDDSMAGFQDGDQGSLQAPKSEPEPAGNGREQREEEVDPDYEMGGGAKKSAKSKKGEDGKISLVGGRSGTEISPFSL